MGGIELHWISTGKTPYCLDDYVEFTVGVRMKNYVNLDGACVVFQGDSYFQPTKEYISNSRKEVVLTFRPWADPQIEKLPSTFLITLFNASGGVLSAIKLKNSVGNFCGDLFSRLQNQVNILLFGLAGSSKSSFINTCYSFISREVTKEIAQSGGYSERVTTELQYYRLVDISTKKITNIRLWDTWGITKGNYENQEFVQMLNGQASDGWKMKDAESGSYVGNLNQFKSSKEAIPQNAVIFFIPFNELHNESSPMLAKIAEFVKLATKLGVSSVIAITKVDAYVPSFRTDPVKASETPDIKNIVNTAARLFNLQPNRICPLINYLHENVLSFEVDRVAFRLLYTAYSVAKSNCPDIPPKVEAPNAFVCPISAEVMNDPVVAADGFTYEREYITQWLKSHDTSPMTNAPLHSKLLFNNHTLKSLITEWKEK